MNRHLKYLIAGLLLVSFAAGAEPVGELRGDDEAVERVTKMLDQLGGADLWARSKHLYVEQSGWFTGPSEAAVEYVWRSFESPAQHAHIIGRHTDTVHIMTDAGAWTNRKGVVTVMPRDDHARAVAGWFNGSYTMIHRLATADSALWLDFEAPHRVRILDENREEISWYDINEFGHLMKWGRTAPSGDTLEYVYGPMRDFGNLRFPAWGAAVDASWRYSYEKFVLSMEPIDPELLRAPE
ncbi:MAG: hypothetical protein R3288_14935 [Woeseiaceae bacterium]|nr:hypothetical protein [Woeseiaceae bacterium]